MNELPTYEQGTRITFMRSTLAGVEVETRAVVMEDLGRQVLVCVNDPAYETTDRRIFKTSITTVG